VQTCTYKGLVFKQREVAATYDRSALKCKAGNPIALGVVLCLFFGKPLGIWLSAQVAAKLGLATAPPNCQGEPSSALPGFAGLGSPCRCSSPHSPLVKTSY
jgi:hypothetical protein